MKDYVKLEVRRRCHEQWRSFARTSKGGFCASCQKEVIDFTAWSDERIKAYFKNLPGDTCGRFRKDQLKTYSCDHSTSSSAHWMSVFFAGGLLFFSARSAIGQQRNDFAHHPTEQYREADTAKEFLSDGSSVLTISGVVNAVEDSLPLPGVNITVKGTKQGTTTDAEGRFSITVTGAGSSPVLVFSFVGFETREQPVLITEAGQELRVDMTYDKLMDETIIVGGCNVSRWYSPRTWWWKIKSIF